MTWMLTATGRRFDLAEPDPAAVCIDDVARALSKICRFGGHTLRFYSVAEHSVMVSKIVRVNAHPGLQLLALLHDEHEAFTGDRIQPLKDLAKQEGWNRYVADVEMEVQVAIEDALVPEWLRLRVEEDAETDAIWTREIKRADLVALATEKRDVLPNHLPDPRDGDWPCLQGVEPLPPPTHCIGWDPLTAELLFIERYRELMHQLKQAVQTPEHLQEAPRAA